MAKDPREGRFAPSEQAKIVRYETVAVAGGTQRIPVDKNGDEVLDDKDRGVPLTEAERDQIANPNASDAVKADSETNFNKPPLGDPKTIKTPVEGYFEYFKQYRIPDPALNTYFDEYLPKFTQAEIDEVNEVARKESGKKGYRKIQETISYISTNASRGGKTHEDLVQTQKDKDAEGKQENAGSKEEWDNAWKNKQMEQRKNNYGKLERDPTSPEPLLVDKISALPPGSPRRNCYENVKGVMENNTANVGSGTDTLTRESYKEIKNLVKSSDMLQKGVNEPPPTKDQLIGVENGTMVNNLQSWQATIGNAVKPVSDAIGSHADTSSSVSKSPMGPDQMLPQAAAVQTQAVTPEAVSEVEKGFKSNQKSNLLQTPAKCVGSLRQLATCSIPALSFPFDLVSDVYNGTMNLVKQVSKLIDGIMAQITQFAISKLGGLIDGLFPSALLSKLIAFVTKIAGMLQKLFDLLGGFSALAKLSAKIEAELPLGCRGDLFGTAGIDGEASIKTNSLDRLKNKVGKAAAVAGAVGSVIGSLPNIGDALGNLGNMIGGAIPKNLGSLTAQISNPAALLKGMFDEQINKLLKNLPWCCATGCTGDNGFSVGAKLDGLNDNAFTKAMNQWAAHASIISANFNKKSTPIGSFAQSLNVVEFTKAPFATNADTSKGVVMYAPGATATRKIFKL